MDEGTKEAIAEQLRIGAELRRKAERMGASGGRSGSDGDDSTDASDSEDEEGGGEGGAYGGVRGTAKAKAAALEILEAAGQEGAQVPDKVRTGVLLKPSCAMHGALGGKEG